MAQPIQKHLSQVRGSQRAMPGGEISSKLGSQLITKALTASKGGRPFRLSPLPYLYDALEPFIDAETMRWHHQVYHKAYVDHLNRALRGRNVEGLALENILARVSRFPKSVQDNGGGHWNHTFFWSVMTDQLEDHEIPAILLSAIERSFRTFDNFKDRFVEIGSRHLGSGWIWVMKNDREQIEIITTQNNDNPLMDVVAAHGRPILVCDLWEHAYYLQYKAKRDEYLRRFFGVVNWARVCTLFSGQLH